MNIPDGADVEPLKKVVEGWEQSGWRKLEITLEVIREMAELQAKDSESDSPAEP
jgi:hypothetical protein